METKKIIIVIIGIIIIAAVAILGLRFFVGGDEDIWLCQNGQWVKHGNPSSPMPTSGCGNQPAQEPDIVVTLPQPNQLLTSPFRIEGKAKGGWFFEAQFPIKLIDGNGKEIVSWFVESAGDWMTADYVSFKSDIQFQALPTSDSGTLILNNSNPSDLRELDKEIRIPVKLIPVESIKVKVYFNNNQLDPEISCNKVFPVEREIPKTQATARAALEELLKGPSDKDKLAGYITNINPDVKIQKLTIENGVAKVDFDEALEKAVGGSCRVAAIGAQITQTLKQFPTVKNVVISINGRTEDILQP